MRYDPSFTVLVARVSAVPGEVFRACTGVCSRPEAGACTGGSKQTYFFKQDGLFCLARPYASLPLAPSASRAYPRYRREPHIPTRSSTAKRLPPSTRAAVPP
jgi:hypothetical protein